MSFGLARFAVSRSGGQGEARGLHKKKRPMHSTLERKPVLHYK
jgi:hypothetical protein